MSESVNLSLGLRWTRSHATPSQPKTSSTSAKGLMLGMIMPAPLLISVFISFPFFLSCPPLLSTCLSLPLSNYLLSSGGYRGIGQQRCVESDYVWSADSDLTFSMLSLGLNATLTDSHAPHASGPFKLLRCCCFNVSYIFQRDRTYSHMPTVIAPFQ